MKGRGERTKTTTKRKELEDSLDRTVCVLKEIDAGADVCGEEGKSPWRKRLE